MQDKDNERKLLRDEGRAMACEGIVRSHFGKRTGTAGSEALRRLRTSEHKLGAVRRPPRGRRRPGRRNGAELRERYHRRMAQHRRRTMIAIAAAAAVIAITVIIVTFSGSPQVPEVEKPHIADVPDERPEPQPPESVPPAPDIPVPEPEPEKQPTPPKPEPEEPPIPPEPEPEVVIAKVLRTPGGSVLTRDEGAELKDEKETGNSVFTLSKGGLYCTTSDSEEITLGTPAARVVASEGSIFRAQLFEREDKEVKKARILVVALAVYLGAVVISNEFGSEVAGPGEVVFAQEGAAPEKQVAKGNTEFALDLYAKLKDEKKGKNLFFSPYSISSALAMTYAGARGNTAKQMADVLHFDLEQKKLHPAFAALTNNMKISGQKGLELHIANALWGQQGYKFLDEFVALNNKNYGAGLKDVDFVGATEEARKTINKWVEKQTKDKIKNLLKPGVLDSLTRLVLTNAIYFKGDWVKQFDKKLTKKENFSVTPGKKVKVSMMAMKPSGRKELKLNYGETDDAQVLELPYKGDKVSMVILLPKKVDGLSALEKSLSADTLRNCISKLHKRKLAAVYLPKFKMTCEFKLGEALQYLGMRDAFVFGKADFSGMNGVTSGLERLYITAVVHKAFVDVNEEGTEAAAATAVVMGRGGRPKPPPEFRADHPFLFLIRDKATGSILFMGRVVNPKESK